MSFRGAYVESGAATSGTRAADSRRKVALPDAALAIRPATTGAGRTSTTAPVRLVVTAGDWLTFEVDNLMGTMETTKMVFVVDGGGEIELAAGVSLHVAGETSARGLETSIREMYAKQQVALTRVALVGIERGKGRSGASTEPHDASGTRNGQ